LFILGIILFISKIFIRYFIISSLYRYFLFKEPYCPSVLQVSFHLELWTYL
jgi:hypothetical protein